MKSKVFISPDGTVEGIGSDFMDSLDGKKEVHRVTEIEYNAETQYWETCIAVRPTDYEVFIAACEKLKKFLKASFKNKYDFTVDCMRTHGGHYFQVIITSLIRTKIIEAEKKILEFILAEKVVNGSWEIGTV